MAAAYLLGRRHEIAVFEQNGYVGGHANTVTVNDDGRQIGIDTGFVVFNPERYPNLVRLFDLLGIETQETDMSFSVRCRCCNLEYSPQTLSTLFAQRKNLVRPSHYRMIRDGLRAVRDASAVWKDYYPSVVGVDK
jgi:predicted NAD/FAD-binding protein